MIRHLIAKPGAAGRYSYYWQPPTKLRNMQDRPEWLRSTPLRDDAGRALRLPDAIRVAERLNAKLDQWREGRAAPDGGVAELVKRYLASSKFREKAPRTRADYEKHLLAIRKKFGEAETSDITPTVVQRYRESLLLTQAVSPRSFGMADDFRVTEAWLQDGQWVHYHGYTTAELYAPYITHWMPIVGPPPKDPPA